ncbi:hypothetical protein D3C81_901620 [compost metagenome]
MTFTVGVVGANQHVVVQVEQVEAAFHVGVDALAFQAGLGRKVQPPRAISGDRVDRTVGEQRVGVTVHVQVGDVGGPQPVFVETVVQLQVKLLGFIVDGVPVGDQRGIA